MNKAQRKQLADAITIARTAIESLESVVTTVQEEEQEKFDNMPDGLQASPTGETISEKADEMANISGDLQDMVSQMTDMIDQLDEVSS